MRYSWWLAALLCLLLPLGGCYKGCPEEKHEFCARNGGRDCGDVTATNACGEVQTINCGKCYGPDVCGGGGVPGVCAPCSHQPVDKACAGGWCKIPAGCFVMGAHPADQCTSLVAATQGFAKESRHNVALSHRFEIMDAEVTQQEFQALMGYNPSKNLNVDASTPTARMPVEYVSWHEAAAYANALSAQKGHAPCYSCNGSGRFISCDTAGDYAGAKIFSCPGYRLPTEAEWEYAYRAGNVWPLYNIQTPIDCTAEPKLDEIAWNGQKDPAKSYHHEAKTKLPNAWGLYDMAGNVFEWCHDWAVTDLGTDKASNPWGAASAKLKVIRSCAHDWMESMFFRASTRRIEEHKHVCNTVGMRLVRTLGEGNR